MTEGQRCRVWGATTFNPNTEVGDFEVYIVSSRAAWAVQRDPVSKKTVSSALSSSDATSNKKL